MTTAGIDEFKRDWSAKYPKAVDCLEKDRETLLTFFDLPAEHWRHMRSTNAIESTFATVRLRTKVTKGPGSRSAGLAMAFKLMRAAETRYRAITGRHLVREVRAGIEFQDGVRVTPQKEGQKEAA